jgi:thioesterase domain-containing protein
MQLNKQDQPSIWNLVAKNSRPIVRLAGHGDGTPLYLIHAIAGDIGFFSPLADLAADGRTIYGIQVPNHKINAEFGSSVAGLAEYYVDALMEFQPAGAVMLGGWSAGSTIALEMAQLLKRRGRDVALLISFDGILYHTGARLRAWDPRYLSQLLKNVRLWRDRARTRRLGVVCSLRLLWRDLKLAWACWAIERKLLGNVTDTFLEEGVWPPKRLPFIRSLYRAIEEYYPEPYDGRVLVYLAKVQCFFHLWQVDNCWRKVAPAADFHVIPCMHDDMFKDEFPGQMGMHLRHYLSEISRPAKPASKPVAECEASGYLKR